MVGHSSPLRLGQLPYHPPSNSDGFNVFHSRISSELGATTYAKMPTTSVSSQPTPHYVYAELQSKDEIRLVTILPAKFEDEITLRIEHTALPLPDPVPSTRMTVKEIQETLPPDWCVEEINDNRFLFRYDGWTRHRYYRTSWTHPDPTFDPQLYLPPARDGGDDYEPRYEALSYVWGSKRGGREWAHVYQNNDDVKPTAKLRMSKNLASAIRHLRLPSSPRTMWIDAICINQASIPERNTQVLRMVDIYRLASRVVVWLGPASPTSGAALTLLTDLGRQIVTTRDDSLRMTPEATLSFFPLSELTVLDHPSATWHALSDLFQRPWFERLWVVQEIQLSRTAIVYCGADTVPWSLLWNAVSFLFHNESVPNDILSMGTLNSVRLLGRRGLEVRSLSDLARITVKRKCSDKRDLMYGLLGLLPAAFRREIKPRYDLEVWRASRDMMILYMQRVQRLEMFRASGMRRGELSSEGWPSWVPDFSAGGKAFSQFWVQFASGHARCWTKDSSGDRPGKESMLGVEGVRCATVNAVHNVSTAAWLGDAAWVQTIRRLAPDEDGERAPYVTGEPFGVAFAKTLILGCVEERVADQPLPSLATWMEQDSSNPLFGPRARAAFPTATSSDTTDGADITDLEAVAPLTALEMGIRGIHKYRSYFTTDEGYIGIGPIDIAVGMCPMSSLTDDRSPVLVLLVLIY